VNFMNKHCTSWTYNTVRVQEEGYIVCGHHCIFYLMHRCAGHSIAVVTRLLENTRGSGDHCTELCVVTCYTSVMKKNIRNNKTDIKKK
jgi:hypothetical protein